MEKRNYSWIIIGLTVCMFSSVGVLFASDTEGNGSIQLPDTPCENEENQDLRRKCFTTRDGSSTDASPSKSSSIGINTTSTHA